MRRTSLSVLILIALMVPVGLARTSQDGEVDAPQKLMKSFAFLEQRPLDRKAPEVRSWALKWIAATDKVSVKVCSLIASGVDQNHQYRGEIFGQYTIAMAAFKVANPAKANDEDAAQLFGIESALTVYANILRTQPNAGKPFLDDLVAKRSQGQLAKFVKENNCK